MDPQNANVTSFSRRRHGDDNIFLADVPSAAKGHVGFFS